MNIQSVSDYRRAVRQGAYAFPGGYPLFAAMGDGGALCPACLKKERREIIASFQTHGDRCWKPVALEIHYEGSPITCDHCGTAIDSAYGDPDMPEPAVPTPREPFRGLLSVTYSTVTPESAEDGDYSETGYAHPNGGRDSLGTMGDVADYSWRLSSIVSRYGRNSFEDCGRWFETLSPHQDFRTGADTFFSVHPPKNITAASYARLRRILAYLGA